jgi:hypothetical protein
LKVFFVHIFQLLFQLEEVSGRRYNYWSRPTSLPGTSSSFEVASVPENSVPMSAVLKEAEMFRVTTSLCGIFKMGDVLVCTAAFFEFLVVSSVAHLFRLCTS